MVRKDKSQLELGLESTFSSPDENARTDYNHPFTQEDLVGDACVPLMTNREYLRRNPEERKNLREIKTEIKNPRKRKSRFDPEGFGRKYNEQKSILGEPNPNPYEDTDFKRQCLESGGYKHAFVYGGKKVNLSEAKSWVIGRMFSDRFRAYENWLQSQEQKDE